MPDKPRTFFGQLAYNWETKEKKISVYEAGGLTKEPGFRLYRFWAELPPPNLGLEPDEPLALHAEMMEEDDSRNPLPEGTKLVDYVYRGLCRVVSSLIPGRSYVPHGSVHTGGDRDTRTIRCRTVHGAFEITVKEIP